MAVQIYTVDVQSTSPYSQSAFFKTQRDSIDGPMSADEFDKTYWPEKAHIGDNNQIFIPPTGFKRAVDEACKRMAKTVKGKGTHGYAKYVEAGTGVNEPIYLFDHQGKPITADRMKSDSAMSEITMCNSQGKKGGKGGSTVPRKFPLFPQWQATVEIYIYDATITSEGRKLYETWVANAGLFVGLGRFRPQNGGYYGRFRVLKGAWASL